MPSAAASARSQSAGRWISTPQPSPLMPSAFTPPRWESFARAANAVSTSAALARPSICATRPKPQLSCSKAGSYNVAEPLAAICPSGLRRSPRCRGHQSFCAGSAPTKAQLLRRVKEGYGRLDFLTFAAAGGPRRTAIAHGTRTGCPAHVPRRPKPPHRPVGFTSCTSRPPCRTGRPCRPAPRSGCSCCRRNCSGRTAPRD